ncbi:metallophosphoesterase [Chryseobacterium gleum]|uniref:metallophosphoesterase family protein n=1 Tax=Chryseobacterium gleum TaxID=250 RepID=UPI00258727AA|nr:metallophosphoesterase [Chryseobacterium gleum]
MRIVHISDIHLSDKNFSEFENNYREPFLQLLHDEHAKEKIDTIVITGDLVDQGGHSLLKIGKFSSYDDPYKIFEEEFILPIKDKLGFDNSKFLFVPGNHDINENDILWVTEKKLKRDVNEESIKELLEQNKTGINVNNDRIKLFKNFERKFHENTSNYVFSYNESTYLYETADKVKIGYALINDSWRCSTCRLHEEEENVLYFGSNQLYDAFNVFRTDVHVKILLTHHPTKSYAKKEQEEVERILLSKKYHLHLFGHSHHHKYENYISPNGKCFGIMARSALNKPSETESKWQPGFHIIDINLNKAIISAITYYKYMHGACDFAYDTETALPSGIDNTQHSLSFDKIITSTIIKKQDLDRSKFSNL